jgi:hypothetical protein
MRFSIALTAVRGYGTGSTIASKNIDKPVLSPVEALSHRTAVTISWDHPNSIETLKANSFNQFLTKGKDFQNNSDHTPRRLPTGKESLICALHRLPSYADFFH